ncbi:protein NIM1-INTERACTING 1-like [Melia azedarach]|uniref:Protein NIM1-INTERACTING 1-like n=1 Tax=Melia azedarach TaxID=155640 RepID=A0ACC1YW02_MELAZ|nr:protein NIM1-INTERACTING 1-like [Melia azedarach]
MENEVTDHQGTNVHINGEDDQQEEEKMERFLALIRNFQEARNRRTEELKEMELGKGKMNKMRRIDHVEESSKSWVPKFELQDFTEEIEFRKPPVIFPNPSNNRKDQKKRQQQQQEDDDGLDLKLTL